MSTLLSEAQTASADELDIAVKGAQFLEDIEPPALPAQRIVRSFLFQATYGRLVRGQNVADALETQIATHAEKTHTETPQAEQTLAQVRQIAIYIDANAPQIATEIGKLTTRKNHNQTSLVNRCILTMAMAELAVAGELTPAQIINEAVEMAKVYSDDNSVGFVNGLLRKFANS